MNNSLKGNYAEVNGLNMYYEIHGAGEPLVVLHGAYMTIDAMGEVVPELAKSRQVIAVELQGHGRTADIEDRPITYEQMADDIAALLRHLAIEKPMSSATVWGAASPFNSPSGTPKRCASWWSPRPPTRAMACTPSCWR
jgi:pimeloyl-ACP methyl ester carboxylesterase